MCLVKKQHIQKENLYETNSFYIVEGQQRITSIIIILKCILDYAKENTSLPDKPDYDKINNFVADINEKIIKNEY